MPDEPSCSWCDSAQALERVHGTEGQAHYLCPCCGKTTRVDDKGIAHRVEPIKHRVCDVNGVPMFDP